MTKKFKRCVKKVKKQRPKVVNPYAICKWSMNRRKQLMMGIRVEREHSKSLNFIKEYYKKHKKFPSKKEMTLKIVQDHLKEDPYYYTKLKKRLRR